MKRLPTLTAGLAALSFAGPASAATTPPIAPATNDTFMNMLTQIVGPVIGQASGWTGGTTATQSGMSVALVSILKSFNSVVLILGGFYLTYIVIAGVMKTAHEGEALGQRWSEMWVPMKMALGAAALLPIPSLGGFSAMQGIMIWLITFAVGSANMAWQTAVTAIAHDPGGTVYVSPTQTASIARGIMQSQVCTLSMNRLEDSLFSAESIQQVGPTPYDYIPAKTSTGGTTTTGYYSMPGVGAYTQQYSEYRWTPGATTGWLSSMGGLSPTICGNVLYVSGAANAMGQSSLAATVLNNIGSTNSIAIGKLINALQPISQAIYDGQTYASIHGGTTGQTVFNQAVDTYDSTMQSAITSALSTALTSETSKYVAYAQQNGFANAGSWFLDLSRWNNDGQQIASHLGSASGAGSGQKMGPTLSRHYQTAMARLAAFDEQSGQGAIAGTTASTSPPEPTGSGNDLQKVFGKATQYLASVAEQNPGESPLFYMQHLGEAMETAGGIATAAVVAGLTVKGEATHGLLGWATESFTGAAGAASVFQFFEPTIRDALLVLFGGGWALSFLVPMIPFLIWTFAVLGFLLQALEMLFAAPIFAVSHMHPEGHEVVGQAAGGYRILLAILVRPFLMTAGLIGGFVVLTVIGGWVGPQLVNSIVSAQNASGSYSGLFDLTGGVIVNVGILIAATYMSFGLIMTLPNAVSRWASADSSGGDYGGGDEGNRIRGQHAGYGSAINAANRRALGGIGGGTPPNK